MRTIDIFIQGGALPEVLVGHAAPTHSLADVLANLKPPIFLHDGELIFVEDLHCPLNLEALVEELLPLCADDEAVADPLKLHISRCRQVEVSVRFNNEQATRRFPPGATIGRVHHWAARRAFGLSPRDAAEHVLQIQGTQKRPDRDVHIGTLTQGTSCGVAFDLVPRKRVEG